MENDFETTFRRISKKKVGSTLEAYFVEDAMVTPSEGRVLFPRERISPRDLVILLLSEIKVKLDPDDGFETVEEALFDEYHPNDVLEWLVDVPPEWLVRCWVESSMVSGDWGIKEFSLAGRGYLYHEPDESESLGILSSWEPVEDREAFAACFIETYLRLWPEECLPPKIAEFADGPPGLMEDAIWQVLQRWPETWSDVIEQIHTVLNPANDLSELSNDTVIGTQLSRTTVEYVFDQVKASSKEVEKLVQQKEHSQLGRAVTTIFWHFVQRKQQRHRLDPDGEMEPVPDNEILIKEALRIFGDSIIKVRKRPG